MKRGKGSSFGDWTKANVQRKGNQARIQTKPNGDWVVLKEFPKNLPKGIISVQFNLAKRKVNSFKPLNGVFTFKTTDFGRKEGQPPVPKHKVDNWGNDVYTFVAVLEIQNDEKFGGCVVPYLLRYKFEPIVIEREGEERQALGTAGYGKHTEQLENYLQVSGVWNRDFPYKDNALPMLMKAILKEGKSFQGNMENGWITSLYASSVPTEDTDFEGDDEETPWKE